MSYFFGAVCSCPPSSGGVTAGKYISVALAAGTTNDLNPGSGWPTGYGRLDLVRAGAATLNSLKAGVDGQEIFIRNASASQTVTIPVAGGGTPANEFTAGGGGTILPPLTGTQAVYYGGTINNWVLVQ
jgi:hypothetical protein